MSVFLTVQIRVYEEITICCFFPAPGELGAMAQQKVVADKIVGIVGDKIILKSEIFIANEDIKRSGRSGTGWLHHPGWYARAESPGIAG